MTMTPKKYKIGDLRPSQILFSFGIGAVVDLPNMSALVMGLDDWDTAYATEIGEERLLAAVRGQLGGQVKRLLAPPLAPEGDGGFPSPFDPIALVGVPVSPFPRWMLCPWPGCRLLAPLESGLFELKTDCYHPDRTRYVHANCPKPGAPPTVLPSRFLVACRAGHLDDFPWIPFVHGGPTDCKAVLRLRERGVSGEATDVTVTCDTCGKSQIMSQAFGRAGSTTLPACRGRRPQLRDCESGCQEPLRAILLGASNSWFPLTLSALAIPTASGKLAQLVETAWSVLEKATTIDILKSFRSIGVLPTLAAYSDDTVWSAVEAHRAGQGMTPALGEGSLRAPEWTVLTEPDPARNSPDFRLSEVEPPAAFSSAIDQVVLVERLRQVQALIGFTRLESPGDFADVEEFPQERRAPLSRKAPQWAPASEVRGEGIFIRFDEDEIARWERSEAAIQWSHEFFTAHREWRTRRRLAPPNAGYPGLRYVFLHSFSHALMRQFSLECGYTAASIRERIYSLPPEADDGPMAGVLIYTAAPDSEGTLGGLVNLGRPEALGRHIAHALEGVRLCASDPLCSEHHPGREGVTLHGAACHACLFVPETSCERGNKYLDRSLLVETIIPHDRFFFSLKD